MARYIVDSPDRYTAGFTTKAAALTKAAELTGHADVGVLLEHKAANGATRDELVAHFSYGIQDYDNARRSTPRAAQEQPAS